MSEEQNQKTEWRLTQLEGNMTTLTAKIENIEQIVIRMDSRLPSNGLQCPIHTLKLSDLEKRTEQLEIKSESMHKKIITWTAVISVILFLFSQVFLPYALENYKVSRNTPQVQVVEPWQLNLGTNWNVGKK